MKPRLFKRGNTWWCTVLKRYSFGDTPAIAYANFIWMHVKR